MLAYIHTSNLQSIYKKPHKLHVHNWELHACMNVSSCNLCLIFGMQNVYTCSSFIVLCACIIYTYVRIKLQWTNYTKIKAKRNNSGIFRCYILAIQWVKCDCSIRVYALIIVKEV